MDDTPHLFLDHFVELRKRLLVSLAIFFATFSLCYLFAEDIFHFLVRPLAQILQQKGGRRMIYTGLTEAFLTYIKVAGYTAAFFCFPLVAQQIWLFIAPGLYQKERRLFLSLTIVTPLLFLTGAAFAYYVVFPRAYTFFISFESAGDLPIALEAKVNEYLAFVIRLIFAFGLCFELPVILMLLAHIGLVTSQVLIKRWRLAIVGIFILAAIVTPPDILSMVALALPLIGLYGISILVVRISERNRHA